MPSLRDLQIHFKNAVFHQEETDLDMQVYRNNLFISLTENLKNIYPTIEKLVGEDFFENTAHEYIMQYPSMSGDLANFGNCFSDFLSTFSPAETLPYLPEVAQFEWACHEVFHEAQGETFDINQLRTIPPEKYGDLKFTLHPASRLLEFQYPILDIWELCCTEDSTENSTETHTQDKTVDLDVGGEKLLIIRRQLDVTFEKLNDAEFVFLSAFSQGLHFEEVCTLALQTDPNFNIETCFKNYLLNGTLSGG